MKLFTIPEKISLFNADCLEILPIIGKVDMVLIDLPYGVTKCDWDNCIPSDKLWEMIAHVTKANTPVIMTAIQPYTSVLINSNLKNFRYTLVWDKIKGTGFLNAKKMPMRNHEDVIVFYEKLPTYNPQKTIGHKRKVSFKSKHLQTDVYGELKKDSLYDSSERYPRSIIDISTDTQTSSLHPTQKPVALMEYLIKTYSNENDVILDFCMGSGTTGIACLNTKRKFIGIEKDDKYYEIAKERIINHE